MVEPSFGFEIWQKLLYQIRAQLFHLLQNLIWTSVLSLVFSDTYPPSLYFLFIHFIESIHSILLIFHSTEPVPGGEKESLLQTIPTFILDY